MAYQGETIFPKGMMLKKRGEKTPEWIKLSISFKVDEFTKFMKEYQNEGGWLTVDLKKSKEGNHYFSLNTFKPEKKNQDDINV